MWSSSSGNAPWFSPGVDSSGPGWRAALQLAFAPASSADGRGAGDATVLARRRHHGPLAVQRAFFPEGPSVCHVYLLHPPGGIVGGDQLRIDVSVAAGAHALLTTPAATKVYRSAGAQAGQRQRLSVAAGGVLEWLPQETILFDGSHVDLRTRVDLVAGARFVGMETLCFGLPARGEAFGRGRCRQSLELWQGGRPLLVERGRFDGDAPVSAARWGLSGAPVLGTLLAAPAAPGALLGEAIDEIRALCRALPAGDLGAVTVLGQGGALVCRYLGASAERCSGFLRAAWGRLRPVLLARPALAPRIWAT
ncbi:MAG TPA: urease accessory protein UreD [Polyangia bacterium]|nr:urease accessory protein UreD [Polyangia bacterium]